MVSWVIISSGANYRRRIGKFVNRRAIYLGASTTTKTILRTVKPLSDNMLSIIHKRLSTVDKTVWILDNNQRGHPSKYQRFGSSNTFVKVTRRTCYKCITCNDDIGNENEKWVPLTYVNQSIVNPINFSIFEKDIEDMMIVGQVRNSLLIEN